MLAKFACVVMCVAVLGCSGAEIKGDPVFDAGGEPLNIYQAAKAGNAEAAAKFIQLGQWDPSRPDETGVTPLNHAAKSGNVDIIRMMAQNGSDVNQQDMNGDTPLAVAQDAGHDDAVQVLKELGAQQ